MKLTTLTSILFVGWSMCRTSSGRVQRENVFRGGRNGGCSVMRVGGNNKAGGAHCGSRNVGVSKYAGATCANRNNRESQLVNINRGDSGRIRSLSRNECPRRVGGLLVSIWLSRD